MHIENFHIHLPGAAGYSEAVKHSIEYMDGQQGKSHGGYFGSAGWAGATLRQLLSELQGQPQIAPIPRIGQYWLGQGGIYVGMGRGYEGMPDHHLILPTAPKAIFKKRALGTYGVDVAGANSDHNGMANTIALAEAGSDLCKEIRALVIDGHDDFYLMSRTDGRLCMANVPEQFDKVWYLLSTQYSGGSAWTQNFDYGYQGTGTKEFEAPARAVRRLIL